MILNDLKLLSIILLFVVCLSGCYTTWETEKEPPPRPPVNDNSIYIINTSAAGVTINLSQDRDEWREFRLESDKSIYLEPNSRGELYLRIYNSRGGKRSRIIKNATLLADGRYGVYYDSDRKLFDIGKMRSQR